LFRKEAALFFEPFLSASPLRENSDMPALLGPDCGRVFDRFLQRGYKTFALIFSGGGFRGSAWIFFRGQDGDIHDKKALDYYFEGPLFVESIGL
jgi:hypothetical protein